MSDLVERLREYASDDHERLCQGRCYSCSCGYDDKRDPLLEEAAARIAQLEAALHKLVEAAEVSDECQYGTLSTSFVRDIALAALGEPRDGLRPDRRTNVAERLFGDD